MQINKLLLSLGSIIIDVKILTKEGKKKSGCQKTLMYIDLII